MSHYTLPLCICVICDLSCVSAAAAAATAPSIHFGCVGELWKAAGRLPVDWSFAGVSNGDKPIPNVPQVANIKLDFGAKGDNVTDDTAAFLKALNTTSVSGL